MRKKISFKCPYGDHAAYYFGGTVAGCNFHGRLLYTDIPVEIMDKPKFKLSILSNPTEQQKNELQKQWDEALRRVFEREPIELESE